MKTAVVIVLAHLGSTAAAWPQESQLPSAIALGDIHGDFKTLRKLLNDAGLIDQQGHWSGGRQHLIQTGDIVDRGPDSRRALDLLMRLEQEAAAAGGKVVVTMGNHELWNLIGDYYYVSKGEYAAFAKDETKVLRARKRRSILALLANSSPLLRSFYYRGLSATVNARNFDRMFPAGCFAHRAAFSPEGHYGKWLIERPILYRAGKILYVHAGLSPKYSSVSQAELNREARALLDEYFGAVRALEKLGVYDRGFGWERLGRLIESERRVGAPHKKLAPHFRAIERFNRGLLMEEDGPLMYRGLALESERLLAPTVNRILETHGVKRIVIGHTQPKSLRIQSRFNHRVFLIDTGLNQKVYGGRPSVLAVYPGGELRVFE